jgi:hypothetical protein
MTGVVGSWCQRAFGRWGCMLRCSIRCWVLEFGTPTCLRWHSSTKLQLPVVELVALQQLEIRGTAALTAVA